MRRALWLAAGVSALAAIVATVAILVLDPFSGGSGDGNGGESSLQKTLRKMVLQPDDLPKALIKGDESFTTNETLSSTGTDPVARKALLESWGRLMGYEITYEPSSETAADQPVQGINVSSSLYKMAEGAGESFADAVKTAEERDWAANYAGLQEFQQDRIKAEGIADEIVWLRLSGYQPGTGGLALVTDDLVFFRIGTERGFLRVLASAKETTDRAHLHSRVEGWLRTLVQNVKDALPNAPAGDGG
ncbi:MAG: hypothetical protein Q8Q00_10615 [Dehalococcoidia bacterium]|nr:hypothetical protein [Dehalococcoidia bacterium]